MLLFSGDSVELLSTKVEFSLLEYNLKFAVVFGSFFIHLSLVKLGLIIFE